MGTKRKKKSIKSKDSATVARKMCVNVMIPSATFLPYLPSILFFKRVNKKAIKKNSQDRKKKYFILLPF